MPNINDSIIDFNDFNAEPQLLRDIQDGKAIAFYSFAHLLLDKNGKPYTFPTGLQINGSKATLEALKSEFPNGANGLYIIESTNDVYYWNGSAWTKGGEINITYAPIIELSAPSTSTSGNLEPSQLQTLKSNVFTQIKLGDFIYTKQAVVGTTKIIYKTFTDDHISIMSINMESGAWVVEEYPVNVPWTAAQIKSGDIINSMLDSNLHDSILTNLIGMDVNVLYPVDLLPNIKLTMSTSDGSNISGGNLNLDLFTKDFHYLGAYSFLENTNQRTINFIDEGVRYIKWSRLYTTPIQIEYGDKKTPYKEYKYNNYTQEQTLINEGFVRYFPSSNGSYNPDGTLTPSLPHRIRLWDFVDVKKDDVWEIDGGSFTYIFVFYSNPSNIREIETDTPDKYIMPEDGKALIVFRKSDDSNIKPTDFDGEIKIYNKFASSTISTLSELNNKMVKKNLIGTEPKKLYPVDIKQGEYITMSTSDGSKMTVTNNMLILEFYNSDKIMFDSCSFMTGQSSRTYPLDFDCSYIAWNMAYTVPLQVEVGKKVTTYQPYFLSADDLQQEIKNILNKKSEFSTFGNDSMTFGNKIFSVYNPYKIQKLNRYKGQLHTHTTNSDGRRSVDKLLQKYSEKQYDFITISDHNFITQKPDNTYGMIWLADSEEDTRNAPGFQHCNIFGVKEVVNKTDMYLTNNTVESMVQDYVKKQGSLIQYNHPEDPTVYASNETLDNMPAGVSFIEVYNGACSQGMTTIQSKNELPSSGNKYYDIYYCEEDGNKYVNTNSNPDSMTNVWEVMNDVRPDDNERGMTHLLDNGKKVFCTATDDCHFISTFNYGWIQVFADERSQNDIYSNLVNGNFYSSCGVELTKISIKNNKYRIEIENGSNATTVFMGKGKKILKTIQGNVAEYEIKGDESYVWAKISIGNKHAWTQPLFLISSKYNFEF